MAEALWLLSGLWLWENQDRSFGDSSLAYRKSVHQTFRQADFRLPLIWQASYFPALFSSLLVCSPFFILGCWGLPVILLSLPIAPSLSLILVRFSDPEAVIEHIRIPKTTLLPLLRCHRLFIILMRVELQS